MVPKKRQGGTGEKAGVRGRRVSLPAGCKEQLYYVLAQIPKIAVKKGTEPCIFISTEAQPTSANLRLICTPMSAAPSRVYKPILQ